MLRAKKLGPQAYLDFIREELPTESTAITKKDQSYWNSKNQFFQKQSFQQCQQNQKYNIEQVQQVKQESEQRLRRSTFRRTLLQIKSGQKSEGYTKFQITDEDLNRPLIMRSPVHLQNRAENSWNHLEKLDRKHLKQILGPKTINRQKKAISLIDANFEADIQLQIMKDKAKTDFRNKLRKNRPSNETTSQLQGLQMSQLREQKPEYKNLLIAEISIIDKYNSPILFQHVKKNDPNLSIQERKSRQSVNLRSKSFQTQHSDIESLSQSKEIQIDYNESLKKFEQTIKQQCQYL